MSFSPSAIIARPLTARTARTAKRARAVTPRARTIAARTIAQSSAQDTAKGTLVVAKSMAAALYGGGVMGLSRFLGRGSTMLAAVLAAFADRKSTRLNSSHANISYAAVCLKKKN